MSEFWIITATFAAAAFIAVAVAQLIYDWLFRYRLELDARLKELGEGPAEAHIALFRHFNGAADGRKSVRRSLHDQLTNTFHQAGMQCTVSKLVMWCLGCGCGLATLVWWRGPMWALAAFVCGAIAPLSVLYARRHFRSRALSRQLPEAFEMMSRAVRAGQTVSAAFQIIADDFDAPIADEFKTCYEQQDLGMSRDAALYQLAERTGIMELRIFVVALLVQARFGGDLAELLDNLAQLIRKRFKLTERVRALTGEGRMQAKVLTVLPIASLVGLMLIDPQYIQTLLSRPWLLVATAGMQLLGLVWIRSIVRFEV